VCVCVCKFEHVKLSCWELQRPSCYHNNFNLRLKYSVTQCKPASLQKTAWLQLTLANTWF